MARHESCILTNMCMVQDGKGNVLVQDRADPDWPGLCFPGGHVEAGEGLTAAVIREVREETGLEIESPALCGVKHFHTMDGLRYIVFLYRMERFSGELRASEEGRVFWLPLADVGKYRWIPDFEDLLKIFMNDDISELRYFRRDGKLEREFL